MTVKEYFILKVKIAEQKIPRARSEKRKDELKLQIKVYTEILDFKDYFLDIFFMIEVSKEVNMAILLPKAKSIVNFAKIYPILEEKNPELCEKIKVDFKLFLLNNELPILNKFVKKTAQFLYGKKLEVLLEKEIKKHEGCMWAFRPEHTKALREIKEKGYIINLNTKFSDLLKEEKLSESIRWTTIYLSKFEATK